MDDRRHIQEMLRNTEINLARVVDILDHGHEGRDTETLTAQKKDLETALERLRQRLEGGD